MTALLTIVVFIGYISLSLYVFIRARQALPEFRIFPLLYGINFFIASLCLISGYNLDRYLPMCLSLICRNIGGFWAICLVLFALAAFLSDMARIVNRFLTSIPNGFYKHAKKIKKLYLIIVLLAISTVVGYGYFHFVHPQTITHNLIIEKDAPPHNVCTIIAASDLHIGGVSGLKRLKAWVRLINSQQPDVIVLTGDLLDQHFEYRYSTDYVQVLKKLRAKFGVYSILGNHEYYADPHKAIMLMEESDIKVLRDQAIVIDSSLVIIGRDDGTNSHRKLLDTLMMGLNINLPVLLLDHQPIFDITPEKRIDLQISGHLHDGQIIPYNLILASLWTLSYGYKKVGNTHYIVTSGLGLRYIPLRLGTQSEIIKFHLITVE